MSSRCPQLENREKFQEKKWLSCFLLCLKHEPREGSKHFGELRMGVGSRFIEWRKSSQEVVPCCGQIPASKLSGEWGVGWHVSIIAWVGHAESVFFELLSYILLPAWEDFHFHFLPCLHGLALFFILVGIPMERIGILKLGFLSHYQRRLDAHITRNTASRFLKPTLDCMQIPKTHPGDCSSFFEKFSKKLVSYFSPSPFYLCWISLGVYYTA